MLIVRLIIALQKIEITIQELKATQKTHANLFSYQVTLSAIYDDLIQGENVADSIFKLNIANRLTTERLIDDVKLLVRSEKFNEKIKYLLGVLDLVEKFLCQYLQVLQLLSNHYIPGYQKIVEKLKQEPESTIDWISKELKELHETLPSVTPSLESIQLLMQKKLELVHELIRKYVFMFWPDILKKLNKLAVTKDLCHKILKQPDLAHPFQMILETPVQVQSLLNACVDLDVNISQLKKNKDWRLAIRAKELMIAAPNLFRHADARSNTFKAWHEAHQSNAVSNEEKQNYEVVLEAIFSFELAAEPSELDLIDHNSPIMRHREAVQMSLTHSDTSAVSASSSSGQNMVDSIIVRNPQTNRIQARVFKSSSDSVGNDQDLNYEVKADDPKIAEMLTQQFRQFLATKNQLRSKEIELKYICGQANRNALKLFYDGVCAKAQSLLIAEFALASGKIQATHNSNGYVGNLLKVMGTALGPFGGFVFNAIGETIQMLSQRRTLIDAKKIQYIGRLDDVCDVIERYARYLTLQYEVQIRLLQTVEFYQETTDNTLLAWIRSFFSKTRESLKSVKVTACNDAPQEMLADFVVAMIFGNLLLAEKMPSLSGLTDFLSNMMLNGPLTALDHDNHFFNLIGFYKFSIYHSDQKWHAIDIFRQPRIAVCQQDGKMQFWKSPKEGSQNYFWRIGTREEALALQYVVQGDELLTASQEVKQLKN